MNIIVFKLRKFFVWAKTISAKKKLIFVNTCIQNKTLTGNILRILKRFAKRKFSISAHKWIGGSLTNYKNIYRSLRTNSRLSKELITEKKILYIESIRRLFVSRIPRIPALFVSLGDHHDSINEARALGLKCGLFLQSDFKGYLYGDLTFGCAINPVVAITFFSLIRESIYHGKLENKLFFQISITRYLAYRFAKKLNGKRRKLA